MPKPRKTSSRSPSSSLTIEIPQRLLEAALEKALSPHLQSLNSEITTLNQQVVAMRQEVQQLNETLPQDLNNILHHWLKQLQTTMQNETSSGARETLQQQLQQLIAALSIWSNQLKTELSLQQQLIDSVQRLEHRLNDLSKLDKVAQIQASKVQDR